MLDFGEDTVPLVEALRIKSTDREFFLSNM